MRLSHRLTQAALVVSLMSAQAGAAVLLAIPYGTGGCITDAQCAAMYGGDGGPEPVGFAEEQVLVSLKGRL